MIVQRISSFSKNYSINQKKVKEKHSKPVSFGAAIPKKMPSPQVQLELGNKLNELGFNLKTLACKDQGDLRELYLRLKKYSRRNW